MTGFATDDDFFRRMVGTWADQADRMASLRSEVASCLPTGFGPSMQGAARAFLHTWTQLADESVAIASALGDGLRSTASLYDATDVDVAQRFASGRMGLR